MATWLPGQRTVLLCWETNGTASPKLPRDGVTGTLTGTLWACRVCACLPKAWHMAYLALLDPSAGSFSYNTCSVAFPLLCSTVKMHIHIHNTMGTGETQGTSFSQRLKAACLHLTLKLEHLLTLCGCLTQCCETPKPAFMKSRRIHLDLTGVIRNQILCNIWTVSAWQVFRTKTKLEGSSDFLDHRSLLLVEKRYKEVW